MSLLVHPRVKSSIQAPLKPPQRAYVQVMVGKLRRNFQGVHSISIKIPQPSSVFISLQTGLSFCLISNRARFSSHSEPSSVFMQWFSGRIKTSTVVLTVYGLKTEVSSFDPSSVAQKHKLISRCLQYIT